jgi:hypothetical protein
MGVRRLVRRPEEAAGLGTRARDGGKRLLAGTRGQGVV